MIRNCHGRTLPDLSFSEDGYIRLTFQHLCMLGFSQRTTVADDELREDLRQRHFPAVGAGYCDWLDTDGPAQVCIGWAWFAIAHDAPRLLAPGGFSSNIMIVSGSGRDVGPGCTNDLLAAWLSAQYWQRDCAGAMPDSSQNHIASIH